MVKYKKLKKVRNFKIDFVALNLYLSGYYLMLITYGETHGRVETKVYRWIAFSTPYVSSMSDIRSQMAFPCAATRAKSNGIGANLAPFFQNVSDRSLTVFRSTFPKALDLKSGITILG